VTMTKTHFWLRHDGCLGALAVLPMLLILGRAAQAEPDEPGPTTEPTASPPPEAEPSKSPVTTSGQPTATQEAAPYIEHMGPETFPGRSRGLYGGSLWLEPSFDGLQWPQNAHTGLGVSGQFWVDSGYETIERNVADVADSTMYFQQGRGLLRVTPAYVHGRFFVQGQAELVGNLCQTASTTNTVCSTGTFDTDDLWIRVGHWNSWDVKVGRFEGWEIYHLGMGLEPYTFERLGAGMFGAASISNAPNPPLEVPSLYGVNYLHDRPTNGLAVGNIAFHAYFTDYLRLELLARLGADNYQANRASGTTAATYLGGRPTAIFDIGWFKLKVGGEYLKRTPVMQAVGGDPLKKDPVEGTTQKGLGASAQFVFDPTVELGLNAAIGVQDQTDTMAKAVPENSYTTKSFGGFANVRLFDQALGGVGANWTEQLDSYLATGSNTNNYTSQLQGFAACQYLLAGQLYVKLVLAYARAKFQASDLTIPVWYNTMLSGRVRLMYLY
jgi:hypothetical protein